MVYMGRQHQVLAQKKRTKTSIVRKCMMDDDTILRDAIADAERQVKKKKTTSLRASEAANNQISQT